MNLKDIQFGVKYTVEVKEGFEMFEHGIYPNCELQLRDSYQAELSTEDVEDDAEYDDIEDDELIVIYQEDLDNGNIKIYI